MKTGILAILMLGYWVPEVSHMLGYETLQGQNQAQRNKILRDALLKPMANRPTNPNGRNSSAHLSRCGEKPFVCDGRTRKPTTSIQRPEA